MGKTNFSNQKQTINKRSDAFFIKATKKPRNSYPKSNTNPKASKPRNPKTTPSADGFSVKPSSAESDVVEQSKKKPFDKQKWRQQKYSLKSKVEKWQNKRMEHLRHEYTREKTRAKSVGLDVKKIYEEQEEIASEEDTDQIEKKKSRKFKKFDGDDARPSKEELLKIREEREKAKEEYRKKMKEKRKKLNKKTKKGQPIMRGRMELLLQQIQENMNS